MNEITSINCWKKTITRSNFLLLITKDSCEDCKKVERDLEDHNNKIREYVVKRINLDNLESEKLIESIEWIKIEVDYVPFWSLIIDGIKVKSIRGNIDSVKEIL